MSTKTTSPNLDNKQSILYIEDDEANRQLVQFILQTRENLVMVEAATGSSGLQLAIQCQPDIILLDLSLPDISGFEVLKQLRSENKTKHIPVIAITGNCLPEDVQMGLDAGFQGYLGKPIKVFELLEAIDKTIASSQD